MGTKKRKRDNNIEGDGKRDAEPSTSGKKKRRKQKGKKEIV